MDKITNDVIQWIVCQVGAREHYQVAEELYNDGKLHNLFTDYYAFHKLPGNIFRNLNNRQNTSIPLRKIKSFNASLLLFELMNKFKRIHNWNLHMKRNRWFQQKTLNYLKWNSSDFANVTDLFAYSYAALEIFAYAKSQSWKITMGQIDPGPLEEEIVLEEVNRYPQYRSEWQPAPQTYWDNWYSECELADTIQVNSEWSRLALLKKGIPEEKIIIKPLAFTPPNESLNFKRAFPKRFNQERPLRVLFLGQLILRKGIARLIEVAKQMLDQPIEYYLVGPVGIHPIPALPNLKLIGRVARDQVHKYYQYCDVFLFPTLSDGFGLTQLEALAWKMPVIVSPYAGKVESRNIFLLPDCEIQTIHNVLLQMVKNPQLLVNE